MRKPALMIGTAGWGISSRLAGAFPASGTHLERYSRRLACVEINSSFYRPHRPQTYARWARSVPAGFRFAVKAPKSATHDKRLRDCEEEIDAFLEQIGQLGEKLGAVLVQTPPGLAFETRKAAGFIERLKAGTTAAIAVEPRHRSWFDGAAHRLLDDLGAARVAADPARFEGAGEPGGSRHLAYFRFHGTPKIYHSDYVPDRLAIIAKQLRAAEDAGARDIWCIFDNTAEGHALANALALSGMLEEPASPGDVERDGN